MILFSSIFMKRADFKKDKKSMNTQRALKTILLFIALTSLVNCSMLPKKGEAVKVTSNPSAEVIISSGGQDLGSSVGRTPLEINFSEVAKGDYVYLKFISDKHEDYQMVLPANWNQGEVNVKLKEKEKILPAEVEEQMVAKMQELNTSQILGVLAVQKQLQQGEFNKASSEIVNLKRLRTPEAVITLLEGNLSYMKGDRRGALNFYRRSYNLYPKNHEVKTLIDQLQK